MDKPSLGEAVDKRYSLGVVQSHIQMPESLITQKSQDFLGLLVIKGRTTMKNFDVQAISLNVSQQLAFGFIADAKRLPEWAQAFASVTDKKALMRTPNGVVEIDLDVRASAENGTVDWYMTFPDGSIAVAYSRIVELNRDSCVYSFILTPPPVPLEQIEDALEMQSKTLANELAKLKGILERGY